MLSDSSGSYPITNPKALVFVFINRARSQGLLSQIVMSPCSYEYISNKEIFPHPPPQSLYWVLVPHI